MFSSEFSPRVNSSTYLRFSEFLVEGFDPQTKTETISELKLEKISKFVFWNTMASKGVENLVISSKSGKKITYEKGLFNRLLDLELDLSDLTKFAVVEFSDGSERLETRAKLILCGQKIEQLVRNLECPSISMREISHADFQGLLNVIENKTQVITADSEGVKHAMNLLGFSEGGDVPRGVHGKRSWMKRGVEVGEVPLPPQELLEKLYRECEIAKDGSKMIDTHVIAWQPPTLNGDANEINTLEKVATSTAFGEHKIGYSSCLAPMRVSSKINKPLEKGYWFALYKKPVACGLIFSDIKQYMTDTCPGYEIPEVREVIAASFMHYGSSGSKKERILAWDFSQGISDNMPMSRCKESIDRSRSIVGPFTPDGIVVGDIRDEHFSKGLGVCPVQRFF
jgi:hypothetical protein